MADNTIKVGQVAVILKRHPTTIRRWAAAGRFHGANQEGGVWHIPRSALTLDEPQDITYVSDAAQIRTADYADLLRDLTPGSVDLILTDPPYTISKDTGFKSLGERSVPRFAVDMDFGEWDKDQIDIYQLASLSFASLRKGGTAIIWYDLWKSSYLAEAMAHAGFKQLRMIIWEKTNPVPLNQGVNYLTNSREIALLGVKGGNPTFNAKYHSGVFRFPIHRDGGKRLHPTQKPLKLFNDLVLIHSDRDDLVVDPFLGSGTTAIAAVSSGRQFQGGDIDPQYADISRNRLRKALNE